MGDISDMIIDGILCEGCGSYLGDAVGYPRTGPCCGERLYRERTRTSSNKIACPHCGRKVKRSGLSDHINAVHTPKEESPCSPQ